MANSPRPPRSFQKFQKIPLLISIVFLAFSFYAFFFLYQKVNINKELSQQMQTEWQAETSRRSQVSAQDRLIKSINEEKISIESHFAKSTDVVSFLDNMQKLATAVRAASEIVSVDVSKDRTTLAIEMKATGSFESIYKFLTLLENSSYELDFSSVDILRTKEGVTASAATKDAPSVKASAPEWTADIRMRLLSFIQ